jgi:hypothetical protein
MLVYIQWVWAWLFSSRGARIVVAGIGRLRRVELDGS